MSESPTLPTHDLEQRVAEAVAAIRARSALVPRVGITLGSGLGGVVDAIPGAEVFATRDLPHWPASTVQGHAGRLALGTWCGVPVAALSGRSHRYEGYTMDRVTFAVRVMHALGCRTMLFTNAVGAIAPELRPADVMLATGHINASYVVRCGAERVFLQCINAQVFPEQVRAVLQQPQRIVRQAGRRALVPQVAQQRGFFC